MLQRQGRAIGICTVAPFATSPLCSLPSGCRLWRLTKPCRSPLHAPSGCWRAGRLIRRSRAPSPRAQRLLATFLERGHGVARGVERYTRGHAFLARTQGRTTTIAAASPFERPCARTTPSGSRVARVPAVPSRRPPAHLPRHPTWPCASGGEVGGRRRRGAPAQTCQPSKRIHKFAL